MTITSMPLGFFGDGSIDSAVEDVDGVEAKDVVEFLFRLSAKDLGCGEVRDDGD